MMMDVTYAVSRTERATFTGEFMPMDGPFAGFASFKLVKGGTRIVPYESIIEMNLPEDVPDHFLLDMDLFKRGKIVYTKRKSVEYDRSDNEPSMGGAFQ